MNETTQQNRLFDNKKLAALLIPLAVDQLLNSFMGTVDTLVVILAQQRFQQFHW